MQSLLEFLAAFATVAYGGGGVLAQIVRVHRTGQAEGLSLLLIGSAAATMGLWVAVGLTRGDPTITVANAPGATLWAVLCVVVLRSRHAGARRVEEAGDREAVRGP